MAHRRFSTSKLAQQASICRTCISRITLLGISLAMSKDFDRRRRVASPLLTNELPRADALESSCRSFRFGQTCGGEKTNKQSHLKISLR